jgi:hypothetical protein
MSFKTTKFLNEDAPVATGGGDSIAALMARHGVSNNTENVVATPINIEPKEQPLAQEVTPAATATVNSESEQVSSEPQSQATQTVEVPAPQKAEEPKPMPSLQEVLKSTQPDAVLKALGLDDKTIGLLNELKGFEKVDYFSNLIKEWKSNGDVKGYLKELSTDYNSMPAEDLMRHQLRQEYPKASEAQLEILYKKEVTEAFNLNSDDEDEAKEGALLLEAKADKYREQFVERQNAKLLPTPPEPKAAEPDLQVLAQQKIFEDIQKQINESSYTRDLVANNKLVLEDGFSFPINSSEVLDLVVNGDKTGELMFNITKNADGTESYAPKTEHQILVATVQKYGINFLKEYAKHYKSLGGKEVIDPIDNAKPVENNNSSQSAPLPQSVAEWMAKQGRLNSGGN